MNTFWPVSGWMMAYWSNKKTLCNLIKSLNIAHHYIHFKIPGDPCDLIGSQQCDLFSIHTKQPIRIQGLFKDTNQIAGSERHRTHWEANFSSFVPKTFLFLKVFEKQKWDISTDINPVFGQLNFLISNQTSTVHLFKFGNLCMISDQIAPHLVQLPSKIISTNPLPYNFINILNHIYLLDFSCLPQLVLSAKKENIKSSINQEYLTLTTNCNLSA